MGVNDTLHEEPDRLYFNINLKILQSIYLLA